MISTKIGVIHYSNSRDFNSIQIQYERELSDKLSLSAGLRIHSGFQDDYTFSSIDTITIISKYITKSIDLKKIDVSVILIPVNLKHFKLKTGIGADVGCSSYAVSHEGYTVLTSEYSAYGYYLSKQYYKYEIENIIDLGVHFFFEPSYYLDNNLFFSLQALYNKVFFEEAYKPVYRLSPIVFSVGIGYKF